VSHNACVLNKRSTMLWRQHVEQVVPWDRTHRQLPP